MSFNKACGMMGVYSKMLRSVTLGEGDQNVRSLMFYTENS